MTVAEAVVELEHLNSLHGAVNSLIVWAQLIEERVPGFLDSLFTTAEQQGTLNVRDKIQAEIDRIEALEVVES